MRIIAGEFRSRKLETPRDAETTRPIPDRVKESLFAILRGHFEGAAVFDGFAGTGAIGLEAVSRGAARCIMVEKNRDVAAILRRNVEVLGAGDRCEVVVGDALGPGALSRCPEPVDLVFLDPPYDLVRDPVGWKRVRAQMEQLVARLADDGFAALRTPWPFLHDAPEQTPPVVDEDGQPLPQRPKGVPVDLTIPGAVGPETHEYGTTAVHLYMRRRGAPT
jgi:16S rRNA (guanine(966)-N(2))-methyltransferase RsmD